MQSKSQLKYQSTTARQDKPCEAVVLHCSDQRFQVPLTEFLTQGLGLSSYGLIAIPGGGHFISAESFLPKFAKVGLQSLSFMMKRGRPSRIIMIGHDDCLFFKERLQFFFTETAFNDKQVANLLKARAIVMEKYPVAAVEVYFADSDPDGSVLFSSVAGT